MTTTNPAPAIRPDWLPAGEYPFELREVRLGSERITYVDEGEGPTLLFVHTGMWSFIFRDVILRLRDEFRCITLDFPGYGLSADPVDGEHQLPEQAGLLEEFADALGLKDITLVLHDLGGGVGTLFAVRRPELVRAFVMANTLAWKPDKAMLRMMLRLMSSGPITALGSATRLVPRVSTSGSGVGRHLSDAGKAAFIGPFRDRARVRRFHRLMRSPLEHGDLLDQVEADLRERFTDRPVLTIFGERNDPFGFQERHHELFPDHEGVVVERGNHFPMSDDPDLFADSVRSWWKRRVEG